MSTLLIPLFLILFFFLLPPPFLTLCPPNMARIRNWFESCSLNPLLCVVFPLLSSLVLASTLSPPSRGSSLPCTGLGAGTLVFQEWGGPVLGLCMQAASRPVPAIVTWCLSK